MKKIIFLLIAIPFIACNNQSQKNISGSKENIKDTIVNIQSLIELGGEKQYVEMTGASSKNPCFFFCMEDQVGRKRRISGILMQHSPNRQH